MYRNQKLQAKQDTTIKFRIRGAILGTAIGDALGAPFECMDGADIQQQFPSLCGFVDASQVKRPLGIYQNVRAAGEWTDDTQLMRPIMWSITEQGCIDPLHIAQLTKLCYETETLRGWGCSTKESVKRFANGVPWFRASDASIGTGNGVAMRAAPLGCFWASQLEGDQHTLNSIVCVGKTTHHEVGITAGVLQAALIAMSINGIRNNKTITHYLTEVEKRAFGNTTFTDRLKFAIQLNGIPSIAENIGVSSKANESWVTSAAVFLTTKNRRDAIPRLVELVKQGGDTDTTGAMYGALIGAKWGTQVFPRQFRKGLEKQRKLIQMADAMFNVVEKNQQPFVNYDPTGNN